MKRSIYDPVVKDLEKKMVFIAGPRQCGKTTLAKQIINEDLSRYVNWDSDEGRAAILSRSFPTTPGLLVLDEIHKYKRWRNFLKGLYDVRKKTLKILVTGSAKLDYYRRGGDSLQGRYFLFRMHPLSFKETGLNDQTTLRFLLLLSGFPEPYFSQSETEARRWSKTYKTRVIREELVSLEKVSEVSLLEELAYRLPDCVGSPLSINSLKEDLSLSHQTVARWIQLLDNLFLIFRIAPFGAPRIKAIKKESKHYHWDWSCIPSEGPRFENMIAVHLMKWCNFVEDTAGWNMELRFYKDREQREVDFVVTKERKPIEFIECKLSSESANSGLRYLKNKFPDVLATQVCLEPRSDVIDSSGIRLCDARTYLWEKV